MDFLIREINDGVLSTKLKNLKKDDQIKILGPYGEFYLNELSKIKKSLLQLIQFYSNSSIQNNIYQTTQYSYGNDFLLRELVFKIKLLDNTKFIKTNTL